MSSRISREIERKRIWNHRHAGIKHPIHGEISAKRPCCPFCGHAVYSPCGVHPQCQWFREEAK